VPAFALSRKHALVTVVGLLVAVLVAARLLAAPSPETAPTAAPFPAPVDHVVAAPKVVVVDVAGAVRRPGVYRLRQGSRVADALRRAGGPTRRAQTALVNLAAPLGDGQQILVPARGSAEGAGAPTPSSGPISLSSATVDQLDTLPGVGPVTAQKIVAYRQEHGPFSSVDQLDAISGIGPARLESLQGLVIP
jgi:competence protein ComEA